ncbi:hypothetical protein DPMN_154908 [Dreissena polymorpha]|uniref:Uncharacterized protein n=1 Tax=Dreissena polymorpha TaxID=45954 RepID=A0A9D4J668_DREPO|nr:hypothetical protein DPMN_154908 [Dreissena polymorpha]
MIRADPPTHPIRTDSSDPSRSLRSDLSIHSFIHPSIRTDPSIRSDLSIHIFIHQSDPIYPIRSDKIKSYPSFLSIHRDDPIQSDPIHRSIHSSTFFFQLLNL